MIITYKVDEIESIVGSRERSLLSNEPQDSIRVVNVLLTQLDRLRLYSNILILATSNFSDSLDNAFIDRADIVIKVPPPSTLGVYSILCDSIKEMCKINLISPEIYFIDPVAVSILQPGALVQSNDGTLNPYEDSVAFSIRIYNLALVIKVIWSCLQLFRGKAGGLSENYLSMH